MLTRPILHQTVVLMLLHFYQEITTQPSQCFHQNQINFTACTDRKTELLRYKSRRLNRITNSTQVTEHLQNVANNEKCKFNKVCRKLIAVLSTQQNYGLKVEVELSEMLRKCCGMCTKYFKELSSSSLSTMNRSILNNFDVIYPIYNPLPVNQLNGFHFIPVFNMPTTYYITLRKTDQQKAIDMIYGCINMWPLGIMCLLMSLISGFFVWILDTWTNEEEFPRSFLPGLREGFWWSFASMTTVGYGDRIPKSSAARIVAVVWILVGISVCSIFVASLSTTIMRSQNPPIPNMKGMKVGTLAGRTQEALMVAQHGGILHTMGSTNTTQAIIKLIEALKEGSIDGFVLSRPTYYYYARIISDSGSEYLPQSIRGVELETTEKWFRRDDLVVGILVRRKEDYEFFKSYFELNWSQIQACYEYELNFKAKKYVEVSSNAMESLFLPFFIGALVILLVLTLIGGLYEYKRRKQPRENRNTMSDRGPEETQFDILINH